MRAHHHTSTNGTLEQPVLLTLAERGAVAVEYVLIAFALATALTGVVWAFGEVAGQYLDRLAACVFPGDPWGAVP